MPDRPPHPRPAVASGAVERLYVMHFAGAVLGLLALVILTFFTTSRLDRQADALRELGERIVALETELARPDRDRPRRGGDETARPPAGDSDPRKPDNDRPRLPATQPVRGVRDAADGRSGLQTATERAASQPTAAALDSATVRAEFALCVATAQRPMLRLADRDRAAALLGRAAAAGGAAFDGPSLSSLAILARLLDDEQQARRFVTLARAAGFDTSACDEFAVRHLLASNRPAEAELTARALAERPGNKAVAAVLLAVASTMQRNLTAAREALAGPIEFTTLPDYDRVALARVLADLERWDDLNRVLATLEKVPDDLTAARDLLRGVWLVSAGQYAEAVAVLDFLIEQDPGYEAMTWRGVALFKARQVEAGRAALARAADASPGRPEAWFWLGILEVSAGKAADGKQYLHNALAASVRYAPAWEAMATLSLNDNDVDAALEQLGHAVRHDAGRPEAHFLTAVCHAKAAAGLRDDAAAARRDEAAAALRRAFALDGGLLERAAATELIARLFDRDELEILNRPRESATQPSNPTEP